MKEHKYISSTASLGEIYSKAFYLLKSKSMYYILIVLAFTVLTEGIKSISNLITNYTGSEIEGISSIAAIITTLAFIIVSFLPILLEFMKWATIIHNMSASIIDENNDTETSIKFTINNIKRWLKFSLYTVFLVLTVTLGFLFIGAIIFNALPPAYLVIFIIVAFIVILPVISIFIPTILFKNLSYAIAIKRAFQVLKATSYVRGIIVFFIPVIIYSILTVLLVITFFGMDYFSMDLTEQANIVQNINFGIHSIFTILLSIVFQVYLIALSVVYTLSVFKDYDKMESSDIEEMIRTNLDFPIVRNEDNTEDSNVDETDEKDK
ncbi:MAG: hypothetical protein ACOCV8_02475 [Spirochaetota bacterium]